MAEYFDEIKNFKEENPINIIVFNIINKIKYAHDFTAAAKMMKENNIKLEDIASRSIRLSFIDFIKLADIVIQSKGK